MELLFSLNGNKFAKKRWHEQIMKNIIPKFVRLCENQSKSIFNLMWTKYDAETTVTSQNNCCDYNQCTIELNWFMCCIRVSHVFCWSYNALVAAVDASGGLMYPDNVCGGPIPSSRPSATPRSPPQHNHYLKEKYLTAPASFLPQILQNAASWFWEWKIQRCNLCRTPHRNSNILTRGRGLTKCF